MTKLAWDAAGQHYYETGVDHGVLFLMNNGLYDEGHAWNGLTTVTESPSGAEATAQYADNKKYLNLVSVEEFGGTIEAFTYPDEFGECDGTYEASPGVTIGQQGRRPFGLCYRTKVGNDQASDEYGYKLHLVYGALAAPSEKAYASINDSPEAMTLSWTFSTTPVEVTGRKPTALLVVDSTKVNPTNLAALEDTLYGTAGVDPRLPLPDEVFAMFAGSITEVTPTAPTFVSSTGVITIPTVTGVKYRRADTGAVVTGTVTIATSGGHLVINAEPASGAYNFTAWADSDWSYTRD